VICGVKSFNTEIKGVTLHRVDHLDVVPVVTLIEPCHRRPEDWA
jgi:hypothetical protein